MERLIDIVSNSSATSVINTKCILKDTVYGIWFTSISAWLKEYFMQDFLREISKNGILWESISLIIIATNAQNGDTCMWHI